MAIKSATPLAKWLNRYGLNVYCGPRKDSEGGVVDSSDEYANFLNNISGAPCLYAERITRMSEEAMTISNGHTYKKTKERIQQLEAKAAQIEIHASSCTYKCSGKPKTITSTFNYSLTKREQKVINKRNRQDTMFNDTLKNGKRKKMSNIPETCNDCAYCISDRTGKTHTCSNPDGDNFLIYPNEQTADCPLLDDELDAIRIKEEYDNEPLYLVVVIKNGLPYEIFVDHATSGKYSLQLMMEMLDTMTRMTTMSLKKYPLQKVLNQLTRSSRSKRGIASVLYRGLGRWKTGKYIKGV